MTTTWTLEAIRIAERSFKSDFAAYGSSCNTKYSTSIRIPNEQIVISYNCILGIYIIWNMATKKLITSPSSQLVFDLTVEASAKIQEVKHDEIVPFFQKIMISPFSEAQAVLGRSDSYVERIIFVGKERFFDFCRDFDLYFYPNPEDTPSGKTLLFALPGGELQQLQKGQTSLVDNIIREREKFSRAKRDPNFSNKIKKHFNYTCAICGITEKDVLQAAHIKSVAEGGSDKISNGICLCANHHLLLDSGKIVLSKDKKSFSVKNTSEIESDWYAAAKERNFKLIMPKNVRDKKDRRMPNV